LGIRSRSRTAAIERDASGVCLPVEAENHVAQKLYCNMGLTRELCKDAAYEPFPELERLAR